MPKNILLTPMPTGLFLRVQSLVEDNTVIYFRVVLFFTFLGHGFVSLGFSPGYELHYRIFESVNVLNLDIAKVLQVLGSIDILLAVLILTGILPRYVLLY